MSSKIPPNATIWAKIAEDQGITIEIVYQRYLLLRRNLQLLCTFSKTGNQSLLRKNRGCFCGEYNSGFLMVECFSCKFWFHPECIGFWEESEELLHEKKINCYYCRQLPQKEENKNLVVNTNEKKEEKKKVKNRVSLESIGLGTE